MTDPTTWLEYWTEVAALYDELRQLVEGALKPGMSADGRIRARHKQLGERLAELNRIAYSGKLK
jgi:hypothetical protein